MKIMLEQLLQTAISKHREDNLQEAEYLYRAILFVQPEHPDANHNLGILLASIDSVSVALPFFKAALDANSDQKQFWLSYIDALIIEKRFKEARESIDQCSILGLPNEEAGFLKQRLAENVTENKRAPRGSKVTFTEKRKKLAKKKKSQKKQTLVLKDPPHALAESLFAQYQAGEYKLAEELAMAITQSFPDHLLSWKVLGVVLQKSGRTAEALLALEKALALNNEDLETYLNLGVVLFDLSRFRDAEVSYERALKLNSSHVVVHNNLGNAQKMLGKFSEAEASFRRAIALEINYPAAYSNLGILLTSLGRFDEAEVCYHQALAQKQDFVEVQNNLAILMKEQGRIGEAETIFRQVLSLKPDLEEARYNLGLMLIESGCYEEAANELGQIHYKNSKSYLLTCLFELDEQERFYDLLDDLTVLGETNALLGSLTHRSESRYGIKRPNPFVNDPLKYVTKTDLTAECDFKEIFLNAAGSIIREDLLAYRRQTLLSNGRQTAGNLFGLTTGSWGELEKIIRIEVEKYRMVFQSSEDGLIRKWPNDYSLSGWVVSMTSGGKLDPHIHESGWVSGVVYLNVPKKAETQSGNLVVGLDDKVYEFGVAHDSQRVIDVVTGDLVLFPASLMHHTIPFESQEERIVLAFDVVAN